MTPADYAALLARASGFQSGVAKSKEVNTPLRQSAFVAAMIGQFIADKAGVDVLDDGDLPGLVADFLLALNAQVQARVASTAQAQAATDDTVLISAKKLADAFSGPNQSLLANGFQRLPGGLILQCGDALVSASNVPTVVNLPIPFPVGGMQPICCPGGLVASGVSFGAAITSTSQVTLWQSGTNPITMRYYALGR